MYTHAYVHMQMQKKKLVAPTKIFARGLCDAFIPVFSAVYHLKSCPGDKKL